MKRNGLYIGLLLAIVLLASCSKTLPLPDIKSSNKIVLLGELVAGQPYSIRAGQSAAVKNDTGGIVRLQTLYNLSVSLTDGAGNTYYMTGEEDYYTQTLYTIPYTIDTLAPQPGVYTITATHASLGTATVTVQIPAQIQAEVTDTASVRYATEHTLRIKLHIKDPGNTKNYYAIEALKQTMSINGYFFYDNSWYSMQYDSVLYKQLRDTVTLQTRFDTIYYDGYTRQMMYTADAATENVKDNGSFTQSRQVLLSDAAFNGRDYETTVYIVNQAPDSAIDNRGRVVLFIKSISEDYFRFLKGYQVFLPTVSSNSVEQPVKVRGNITNGYGVIGGVSQVTYMYIKDTWKF